MKVAVFSTADYEKPFFERANTTIHHDISYFKNSLTVETVNMAAGYPAICCFISDNLQSDILEKLSGLGVKLIALRSAGYDHVDIAASKKCGLTVVNAAVYAPSAIAEHAALLLLALLRKLNICLEQVSQNNFSLDNLLGIGLEGKTVGIIGTGNIGTSFAKIMQGFGCKILGYDPYPNDDCRKIGLNYVGIDELLSMSDVISLHCSLNEQTRHMIDAESIEKMQDDVFLINTSRGAVVDTKAVISALRSGKIAGYGMDVYEYEKGLFFNDLSGNTIDDKLFRSLQNMSNVIITPHQAYFTHKALSNIANVTLENISAYKSGHIQNQVNG